MWFTFINLWCSLNNIIEVEEEVVKESSSFMMILFFVSSTLESEVVFLVVTVFSLLFRIDSLILDMDFFLFLIVKYTAVGSAKYDQIKLNK